MNKRLFKPGDIVVCLESAGNMYHSNGVDSLIYGKTYMIHSYKSNFIDGTINIYLRKWNGFSGNVKQSSGNCSFMATRFKLKKDLTKEEIFEITKFKFGIKE